MYVRISKEFPKVNPKKFSPGDVVWFVRTREWGLDVEYGTVIDNFPGEICIQLYTLKDMRLINGIPVKEFVTPSPWKKLPKGWTYNTELYKVTMAKFDHDASGYKINNADDIKRAISCGILVRVCDNDHAEISVEIDKSKGWRIVRHYGYFKESELDTISIPYYKAYASYDEAKKEIDDYNAELERQANLSDYDWSVEEIDKTLDRAARYTEDEKKTIRDRLLNLERVEDIETRYVSSGIQWKYCKNKKWIDILI